MVAASAAMIVLVIGAPQKMSALLPVHQTPDETRIHIPAKFWS